MGRPPAGPGDEVNHSRHGVGAVKRAGRPSNDLDPLDVRRREAREVECAPGLVHLDAVDQDEHVVALSAPQKHRRHPTE